MCVPKAKGIHLRKPAPLSYSSSLHTQNWCSVHILFFPFLFQDTTEVPADSSPGEFALALHLLLTVTVSIPVSCQSLHERQVIRIL